MTRRDAKVLLAAAAWTFYVWISRIVIMAGQDTSAGFKAVHLALAVISLAFGVAILRIGLRGLRARRPPASDPERETTRV